MIYIFEEHEFLLLEDHDIYENEWEKGIIFKLPEANYNLHYNKIGWARIIINYSDGGYKDLPFNQETIKLLPENIQPRKNGK